MLDKLTDKLNAKTLYTCAVSLAALTTAWSLLTSLGARKPSSIARDILGFLGLPYGWTDRVGTYLVESGHRADLFAVGALVLGWLAIVMVFSDAKLDEELPSVPAATFWASLTVLLEVDRGLAWFLVLLLVLWCLWMLNRRKVEQAADGLVDVILALIAAVAIPVLLLLGASPAAD